MDMNLGQMMIRLGFAKLAGSDEVQKNFAGATKGITEKLGALGEKFKGMKPAISGFVAKIGEGVAKLQAYRYHVVAVATAIVALTKNSASSAAALSKFHNLTGLSTQSLQRWQQMGAAVGISSDEMTSSMMELQQKMQAVRMGQGDVTPWARLGIGISGDPEKVMRDLSKRLSSMPKAMGVKFGRDLGLSDDMLNMLMEMRNLPEPDHSLILSETEIKDLNEFNISFNSIMDKSKRVMEKLGAAMRPIAEFIMHIFDRLTKAFMTTVKMIQRIVDAMGKLKPILIILGTLLAAMMFPWIAGIVLALAVWEDFMTYLEGGDSIIGDLVDTIKGMAMEFKPLQMVLDAIGMAIDFVLEKLAALTEMGVGGLFSSIGESMGGMWDWMMGNQLPGSGVAPNAPTGAAIGAAGSTTNSSNMTVNINGAKEPKAIVDEIERRRNSPSNAMFQSGTPELAGAKR